MSSLTCPSSDLAVKLLTCHSPFSRSKSVFMLLSGSMPKCPRTAAICPSIGKLKMVAGVGLEMHQGVGELGHRDRQTHRGTFECRARHIHLHALTVKRDRHGLNLEGRTQETELKLPRTDREPSGHQRDRDMRCVAFGGDPAADRTLRAGL